MLLGSFLYERYPYKYTIKITYIVTLKEVHKNYL